MIQLKSIVHEVFNLRWKVHRESTIQDGNVYLVTNQALVSISSSKVR